jgi:hypothetical protein
VNYYIDLFSPETANAFDKSKKDISGFRISRKTYAENKNIGPGDKFICYVTRLQRFIGVLEIVSKPFIDKTSIFAHDNDPFIFRFKVKPLVWLPLEMAIPVRELFLWDNLSFTRDLKNDSNNWTYMVFSSPRLWPKKDCELLEKELINQAQKLKKFSFSEDDIKRLAPHKIRISGKKEVAVSVPDNSEEIQAASEKQDSVKEKRDSIKIQSILAEIGEKLGMKLWLPRSDRSRIEKIWKAKEGVLLDELPLVFDELTLTTIKNIDVLWIRGRSIIRAFEVEDKTSIYSGILRMADLLALQPMLDIKIHIVAPDERRNDVFKQISRPVFSVMEKGPLAELCSYISYKSIVELSKEPKLEFMTDAILDEYSEFFEE